MKLGIDGLAPVATLAGDADCCPPDLCQISLCWLQCNIIADLPKGPLWDEPKRRAVSSLQCGEAVCDDNTGCSSIVAYAALAGEHLHMALMGALWPAIRESHPSTAVTTLDSWLDRLGWQDCFRCACDCYDAERTEGRPPYEIIQPDGQTICCPSEAPDGLTLAVKRGIAIALWRLRLRPIPRVDDINFVIAPLGAKLYALPADECADCCTVWFGICPASEKLPAVHLEPCGADCADGTAQEICAFWRMSCDGNAAGDDMIWPGVLAAECIVRAMLDGYDYRLIRT